MSHTRRPRGGRNLRQPRAGAPQQRKEGDLIIGTEPSAIGTLVERRSRYTMLLHLPRWTGWGTTATIKNGPPLAGHGAERSENAALAAEIGALPDHLRRSLTWDRGKELTRHAQLASTPDIGLLLRSPLAVAAPDQREHQRPAAAVLPQGHRPVPLVPTSSRPSLPPSITDPARASAGAHPLRSTNSSYPRLHKPVLRRPLELAQYTSAEFTTHLRNLDMRSSMGGRGQSLLTG